LLSAVPSKGLIKKGLKAKRKKRKPFSKKLRYLSMSLIIHNFELISYPGN